MGQENSEPQKPNAEEHAGTIGNPTALSVEDRKFLLQLALEAVHAASMGATPSQLDENQLPLSTRVPRACFVTLHKQGELRGCIGQVAATRPLNEAVVHSAYGAAVRDPRFAPVQPAEVAELDVEVSVLTQPVHLKAASIDELLRQIDPRKHGVLLHYAGRTSTFLPQVWQTLPDKAGFMDRLARKAGLSSSAWRDRSAEISVYEVESFEHKATAQ